MRILKTSSSNVNQKKAETRLIGVNQATIGAQGVFVNQLMSETYIPGVNH